jgi:phosphate transport system permease protein
MTTPLLILVLLVLSSIAYRLGKARAVTVAGGSRGVRHLHSLPSYYGALTALWCALPALVVVLVWGVFQDSLITRAVLADLPPPFAALSAQDRGLIMNDVRNVVEGNVAIDAARPEIRAAAQHYRDLRGTARLSLSALALLVAAAGLMLIRGRIAKDMFLACHFHHHRHRGVGAV